MINSSSLDDAWKPVKVGAGGWLTGIDIAPDGSMVVRTDTYGAYLWNGTGWEQLMTTSKMPEDIRYGSGVYEIRFAPSNSNIIYMEALGYIFKSTDKGDSWVKTGFAHVEQDANSGDRMDGQKMAVDPTNPDIVFAGTQHDGLFVTRDGGKTWQQVTGVPLGADAATRQDPGLTGIVFDPVTAKNGSTQTIYVGTAGSGVFRSTDGGVTWTSLAGGPKDVSQATIGSDGTYYATGHTDGTLWKYAGGTWTQLLATRNDIHAVAVDPFDPLHIVAMNTGGALTASNDGGKTWGDGWNWSASLESSNDIPWLETSGAYMSTGGLMFDPNVPGKLWQSGGVGVWNTDLPNKISWLTPIVWNSQSQGIEQLVATDIIAPGGGDPIFAAWDRPFFTMPDVDQYASSYGGGGFSMGWSLDYASSDPSFIVGISDWWGTEQSGYSADGGKTWHVFAGLPDNALTSIGGSIAASSPTNIIWAPANGVAPSYTKDGGVTWHTITIPGLTDWSNFHFAYYLNRTTVTADRVLPNTFYLYDVTTGVYMTKDGGENWTLVHKGPVNGWSYWNAKIEAMPGSAGELFFTAGPSAGEREGASTGEPFMHSKDGGVTWTVVTGVREVVTFGYGKAATEGGPATVFIAGWVNGDYGIYMSSDDAKTWVKLGEYPLESLDSIRTISGDMDIYGRVYVGFGGSGYAYLDAAGGPVTETPNNGAPNQAPTAPTTKTVTIAEDTSTGSVAIGATDADGDALTYALKTGFAPSKGTVTFANGSFVYTPNANANGGDRFTILIRDGKGGTVEQVVTVAITPVNDAPVAPATKAITISNGAASGQVAIGATDVDGDTLTYTVKNGFAPAKGSVSFVNSNFNYTPNANAKGADSFTIVISDGKGGVVEQVVNVSIASANNRAPTAPGSKSLIINEDNSTGAISIGATDPDGDALSYAVKAGFAPRVGTVSFANGTFTYTPNANVNGADSFTILISDGQGGTAEQVVTIGIAPVNDAPTAPTTKAISLAAGSSSGAVAIGASDVDGDTLSYAVKSGAAPAKGSVSFANGNFTYTPSANASGTDSFTILISDGKGGTTEQVVSVAMTASANSAPTAPATKAITIAEDTVAAAIAIGASDADGDALSYELKSGAAPLRGTVSFANDTFTYKPYQDANGSDSFTILTRDGKGGSVEQVVNVAITPVNDAPTAPSTRALNIAAGKQSGDIAIGASDVDGDSLSYAVKAGAAPTKGTVSFANGNFTYAANQHTSGSDSFTIVISDGKGGSFEQVVQVAIGDVANSAPTAPGTRSAITLEDTATGPIAIGANDRDGDTLNYALKDGFTPRFGSVSFANDSFVYTPNQDKVGGDSFTIVISDGHGGVVEQVVMIGIAPVNDAPTAPATKALSVATGGPSGAIAIGASDVDGDTLSYAVKAGANPGKGAVSFANGSFVYTPHDGALGSDSFTILISDGHGGTTEQVVSVAIEPAAPLSTFQLVTTDGFAGAVGGTGDVVGSNGFEDITVTQDSGVIKFDGSFARGGDVIRLPGQSTDYTAVLKGSFVVFENGSNTVYVPIGTAQSFVNFADGTYALSYDAARGEAHLGDHVVGADAGAVFATVKSSMPAAGGAGSDPSDGGEAAFARLILSQKGDVSFGGNVQVFGTNGSDSLNILFGQISLDGSFNRGGDVLRLSETMDHYKAYSSGSSLKLIDDAGHAISIPVGLSSTLIDFAGDVEEVHYDTAAAVMKVGDYAITALNLADAIPLYAMHIG